MSEWRDIETAPKDGEELVDLMARPLVRYALGSFEDQRTDDAGKWVVPPYSPNDRCREAIRAILSALSAAGLAVVPVEPTPEIIAAFHEPVEEFGGLQNCMVKDHWAAMLAASPFKEQP